MNIITIIKRENFKLSYSNFLPICGFFILVLFGSFILWLFNLLITSSMITQKINYQTITTFSRFSNYILFLIVFVFSPILSSSSINTEKLNGALDNILTSNIKKTDLIIAKLIHKVYCIFVLNIIILPFIVLSHIFIGFTLIETISTILLLLFTTILVNMIGLCISSYVDDSFIATIIHYIIVLFIAVWLFYQKDLFYLNDNFTITVYIAEIILIVVSYTLTLYGKVFNK